MMELFITTAGLVRALYAEAIPLKTLGNVQIARASHVEPDADGNWWADLAPSTGPKLGPFAERSAALQAEQHWLTQQMLFPDSPPAPRRLFHDTLSSSQITAVSAPTAGDTVQTAAGDSDVPQRSTGVDSLQYASRTICQAGSPAPDFS